MASYSNLGISRQVRASHGVLEGGAAARSRRRAATGAGRRRRGAGGDRRTPPRRRRADVAPPRGPRAPAAAVGALTPDLRCEPPTSADRSRVRGRGFVFASLRERVCFLLRRTGGRNGYAASGWAEPDRGSRCRKKRGSSVAARPTRETQWEGCSPGYYSAT